MRKILRDTGADMYRSFISGPENFRYKIDPSYKANRVDAIRPEWLQPVREFLVVEWNTSVSDGIEADDNLGIHQTDETIICSTDKDLLQIPGYHYNFVNEVFTRITPHQGWVNFYTQLIMGDKSDNIMGYDGKMRQKVPQFLQPLIDKIADCDSPEQMYKVVEEVYELGDEALLRNGQLLYIQRHEGDTWLPPL